MALAKSIPQRTFGSPKKLLLKVQHITPKVFKTSSTQNLITALQQILTHKTQRSIKYLKK